MLVAVCYERKIHSHPNYYKSLYGVSVPIRVTECWISPLVYTIQYFIIQGGLQSFWCNLFLHCSGHIDIIHQEYLCFLTYIWHWWRCWVLVYCREDTNFRQYRILLQQPGWYLSQALFWRCFCCTRTLLVLYLWCVPSAILLVMRSGKTWVQYMGDHLIIWWGFPSWYWIVNTQHSPLFFV